MPLLLKSIEKPSTSLKLPQQQQRGIAGAGTRGTGCIFCVFVYICSPLVIGLTYSLPGRLFVLLARTVLPRAAVLGVAQGLLLHINSAFKACEYSEDWLGHFPFFGKNAVPIIYFNNAFHCCLCFTTAPKTNRKELGPVKESFGALLPPPLWREGMRT